MREHTVFFDRPLCGAAFGAAAVADAAVGPADRVLPAAAAAQAAVDRAAATARPEPAADSPPDAGAEDAGAEDAGAEDAAAKAQLAEALERLRQTVESRWSESRGRLQEWQAAAVELATLVAGRLLRHQLSSEQLDVAALVAETLTQLPGPGPAAAYLHPEDLDLLHRQLDGQPPWDREQLNLAPDPRLRRGCCRVEGPRQGVLSDWAAMLTDMRHEMLEQIDAE